ncbi:MAG: PP2C family protein-serine/threonine phosphatase [Ignavibacteriales bacterium]|nr:PP2C family protein-serine/threonine phosphatase [Ignavibacteriales bacterium]
MKLEFSKKFIPEELAPLYSVVYGFLATLWLLVGIGWILRVLFSSEMIMTLVMQVGLAITIGLLVVLYKKWEAFLRMRRKVNWIFHFFVITGFVLNVTQTLLRDRPVSRMIVALAAFFALFLFLSALVWLTSLIFTRGKKQVDEVMLSRGRGTTNPLKLNLGGWVAIGFMNPRRRWLFLGALGVLWIVTLYSVFVLVRNDQLSTAGILFVSLLGAGYVIESVFYTEIVEKRSVEGELQAARTLQMGLLPKEDPSIPGFDIAASCQPAYEVGGDFYDYLWLDEEKTKLGIAVADVSGKAMSAAMTAVMTSGMVYQEAENSTSPKSILSKINRPMYLKTDRRVFTAMCFATLDTMERKLSLSNAGQTLPILLKNSTAQFLKVDGERLPLGIKAHTEYQEKEIALRSGNVVVFYTDGVTEAENTKGELFGVERLEELLKAINGQGRSKDVVGKILDAIKEFSRGTKQHDDITVVVVRVQ